MELVFDQSAALDVHGKESDLYLILLLMESYCSWMAVALSLHLDKELQCLSKPLHQPLLPQLHLWLVFALRSGIVYGV